MAKTFETAMYSEYFEFILENEDGVISTTDLIKYLANLNQFAKSVNHTLNSQYAAGFDQVILDVIALEKGSFKIPVIIKKFINSPYGVATYGAVIAVILQNVFSGKNETINYNFNNCNVEIRNEKIMMNKDTVRAVSNIAKTIVVSPNVQSLSIESKLQNEGQIVRINVDKTKLQNLIVEDTEDNDKQTNTLPRARLLIISPVLEAEQAMWKVRVGDRKFSARMTDNDFLKLMDEQKIAFGKGDTIAADLETTITIKSDNTPDVKHYIRKVYEYPQYSDRQAKENNLFTEANNNEL